MFRKSGLGVGLFFERDCFHTEIVTTVSSNTKVHLQLVQIWIGTTDSFLTGFHELV